VTAAGLCTARRMVSSTRPLKGQGGTILPIGNLVMRRHGAVPWRFSGDDYRVAEGGRGLQGNPVAAAWDADLAAAMVDRGRAVHEEEVLDLLLRDLAEGCVSV
jgi:hypothetical protein